MRALRPHQMNLEAGKESDLKNPIFSFIPFSFAQQYCLHLKVSSHKTLAVISFAWTYCCNEILELLVCRLWLSFKKSQEGFVSFLSMSPYTESVFFFFIYFEFLKVDNLVIEKLCYLPTEAHDFCLVKSLWKYSYFYKSSQIMTVFKS